MRNAGCRWCSSYAAKELENEFRALFFIIVDHAGEGFADRGELHLSRFGQTPNDAYLLGFVKVLTRGLQLLYLPPILRRCSRSIQSAAPLAVAQATLVDRKLLILCRLESSFRCVALDFDGRRLVLCSEDTCFVIAHRSNCTSLPQLNRKPRFAGLLQVCHLLPGQFFDRSCFVRCDVFAAVLGHCSTDWNLFLHLSNTFLHNRRLSQEDATLAITARFRPLRDVLPATRGRSDCACIGVSTPVCERAIVYRTATWLGNEPIRARSIPESRRQRWSVGPGRRQCLWIA